MLFVLRLGTWVILVLLPGLDGTGDLFDPFISALGSDVEVSVIRYPPTNVHSYQQHLEFALSHLPTDKPFVILGESFSGPIAVSIAARQLPGLAGLILCCSFAKCPRCVPKVVSPLLRALPMHFMPDILVGRLLLQQPVDKPLLRHVKRAVASVSVETLQARLRAILGVDVAAELSSVTVPLLNIRAGEDALVPAPASATIAALCTHTQDICLPGPHALLQCSPDAAAVCIERFVRSVS